MASHDQSYKLLFSHPRMVRDLLVGFVRGNWRAWIDPASLEKTNSHFVTDGLRLRASDAVWRACSRRRGPCVYLLLEFQSTVDRFMAARVLTYMGLLYQDLIRARRHQGHCLPPVFPIVLYNGNSRWRAPTALCSLTRAHPAFPKEFRARVRFQLIDIRHMRFDAPYLKRNLVAAMFRIENSADRREIRDTVGLLLKWLHGPHSASLRRSFAVWINKLILKRLKGVPRKNVNNLEEIYAMLADRWTKWEIELKDEGRREGRTEQLLELLRVRFDRDLPKWALRRVRRATNTELRRWGTRIFKASSLRELFEPRRVATPGKSRIRARGSHSRHGAEISA